MFNPANLIIDDFVSRLKTSYLEIYSNMEPDFPGVIEFVGRMALENIANSDAPYHDINHTVMVTLVGQEIIRGRHLRHGGVSPRDWLHFIVSLLCHDIGYVRNVCQGDSGGNYVAGPGGETITLEPGSTDAALTPYHVERGKRYVRERFGGNKIIDADAVCTYIEHTRFPVPAEGDYKDTDNFPGLVRAADLIGQLADPNHSRKTSALYAEFEETGTNTKLGFGSAADLRADYPAFYWHAVSPYIQDGLRYLRLTQQGKQWVANLYAGVFTEEHKLPGLGPERGT